VECVDDPGVNVGDVFTLSGEMNLRETKRK
jgi:hypothetical protein